MMFNSAAARDFAILVKQKEWEEFSQQAKDLKKALSDIETELESYEEDAPKGAATMLYTMTQQQLDRVEAKIEGLEDWLVENCAPGWAVC